MEDGILKIFSNLDINLEDCRGQSYDNGSKMSGVYRRLQAGAKSKNNLAIYFPSPAHSLSLTGESAAECCAQATKLLSLPRQHRDGKFERKASSKRQSSQKIRGHSLVSKRRFSEGGGMKLCPSSHLVCRRV